MRRTLCLPAALLTVAVALASAQTPAPPAVFRSGVELVRFDLSVVDADGRPLPDVRPDEIQVVEDGQVLPLILFQRVQEPAGRYGDAAMRAVSAEVTSNDATPHGHLYIFVFDQAHIAPGNEEAARRAAETFIRARVRQSDRVAVYGVPGPGPDLAFTADQRRAIAELQRVRGTLDRSVTTGIGKFSIEEAYEIAAGNSAVADNVVARLHTDLSADITSSQAAAMGGSDRGAGRFAEDNYSSEVRIATENAKQIVRQIDTTTRDSLQRLADLMLQFKAIEGRKTIVLFSEGFHDAHVSRELQDVAAAAAESYSVFYAMDLNRRLGDMTAASVAATTAATEIQNRTAPLASLALETDGAFVSDAGAQLGTVLGRLADQSQDYYIAGFMPSAKALAERGSYRRVTVRVKRPGARVSARTGYALPATTSTLDRRRAIDAALAAPFAQQALKVDYTTYLLRSETTGRPRVLLSLAADLPVGDRDHHTADVVFVVRDVRDGRVVASGTGTMPLPSAQSGDGPLGRGTYRVQFDAPPGAYMMRAVVREPGGLVGSADRRLEVRALNGPGVAASDLVLGSTSGTLPVRATAYADEGLGGALEVYGRTAEQLSNVIVHVTLARDGSDTATALDAGLTEAQPAAGGVMRRATFALPLNGVAPGAYVVNVHVRAGGEDVTDLVRQVDVKPGAAPANPESASPPLPSALDVAQGQVFRRATTEWKTGDPAIAAHAAKGFELFSHGEFAASGAELQRAFDANPKNAATAFVLGWAWSAAGDSRKAISAWRAAAFAEPTLVPAHLALADAYERLSNPDLAVQALRAGLAAVPDSVELKARLAQFVRSPIW